MPYVRGVAWGIVPVLSDGTVRYIVPREENGCEMSYDCELVLRNYSENGIQCRGKERDCEIDWNVSSTDNGI